MDDSVAALLCLPFILGPLAVVIAMIVRHFLPGPAGEEPPIAVTARGVNEEGRAERARPQAAGHRLCLDRLL